MHEFSLKKTIAVFIAAYIIGLIFGVGAIIGIRPTNAGFVKLILQFACLSGDLNESSCKSLIPIVIGLSIGGLILSIITHIKSANNFVVGLVSYIIGWLLGFLTLFILFMF